MKKAFLITLIILIVLSAAFYISGINDTPQREGKTVLDIRNETDTAIDDISLSVYVPEGFVFPDKKDYFKKELSIPKIMPKERIIVIVDQSVLGLPGMGLMLNYDSKNNLLGIFKTQKDRKFSEIGFTSVITIKKDGSLKNENINNLILDKGKTFYYKRYSKIIDLK